MLPGPTRFLSLAVCFGALSSAALAAGAVAVADEPNGTGWAVEISVRETPSLAKAKALEGCRKRTVESKFDPDLCQIVSEFKNRCAAAYMNPDGSGEGWAVADSIDEARKLAQDNCAGTAGGDAAECKAVYADCDTLGGKHARDKKAKDKSGKAGVDGRPRANTPR